MTTLQHSDAETLFFQGTHSMQRGDATNAEACFRKALQLAPNFAEAYANLGLLLDRQGVLDEAEACYLRAIELNPGYFETCLNLGALLVKEKRFHEAKTAYQQAIALKQHAPSGWSNLGVLYACIKNEAEAERCYRMALFLDESYTSARFNLGYLLLRQGRFEQGWAALEARNWYPLPPASCPQWQGEPLTGKSVLIAHEAGLGDMIQFCRYAAQLKIMGAASVTLICPPALQRLFESLEEVDEVICSEAPVLQSVWDCWTPVMSLPYYCKTRSESIPASIPYLHASPELVEQWAAQLPQTGLNVGLVWRGNPLFENDNERSLASIDLLAPLWKVAGINLISLQKGGDVVRDAFPLINMATQLADFADTAALVMNLDLVISVDTAVAHLTGALGKPCWMLLPDYKTDWRWQVDRADTPWYPGVMRLFRQANGGDWASVIADVVAALELWVKVRPDSLAGQGLS